MHLKDSDGTLLFRSYISEKSLCIITMATIHDRTVQSLGYGAAYQDLLVPCRESLENDHNTRNKEFMFLSSVPSYA